MKQDTANSIATKKEILQLTRKSLELKSSASSLDRRRERLVDELQREGFL